MLSRLDLDVARRLVSAQPGETAGLVGLIDHVDRLFQVATPQAPGFYLVGSTFACLPAHGTAADIVHFSASGNGETLTRALLSCLAEAAELLTSVERPGDTATNPACPPLASGWVGEIITHAARSPDWVTATAAATAADVAVPADLVFRRAPARQVVENPGPLSAGVAAGPTSAAAAERAILELVERDALALWWLGGRSPREAVAVEQRLADDLLVRMRGSIGQRVTHICDLTTDLGIPVCFAYSHDRNGFGLACGAAARRSAGQATHAAILEMLQMEMAGTVALAKQLERGDDALNAVDRRSIARLALHVPSCAAFATDAAREGLTTALGEPVASHLLRAGIDVFLVSLMRPEIGIEVVRAIAPQLQPFVRSIETERLRLVRAVSSSAPGLSLDIDLL